MRALHLPVLLVLAPLALAATGNAKAPAADPSLVPDLKAPSAEGGPSKAAVESKAAAPAAAKVAPSPAAHPAAAGSAPAPDGGALAAAAPVSTPKANDELFDEALSKHFKEDWVGAARRFYSYVRGSSKTADRYEWALHFLALDLDHLGFKQVSLQLEVEVGEERARPEVLPDVLNHVEELINHNPYPAELVEDELLHATDFGPLPSGPRSFVAYYQGLVDYRQGQTKWGDRHFARVDADSRYSAKVKYLKGVYALVHERDEATAREIFEALANGDNVPRDLQNQAKIALARLDYEAKEYQASYDRYGSVLLPELDPGHAPIYLERAWNLYRLKKYGDAMGLLAAVEAPSFRDVFLPDKFLLRSLVYKDLCHYLPSKRSAREFARRYATSLKVIRTREPMAEDAKLMDAALQTDEVFGKATAMKAAVDKETDLVDRYASPFADSGLANELHRMYGLLQAKAQREYENARDEALKRAADRLLVEEEQLRLQDYEVGLAMYQRFKRGRIVTDAPKPESVPPDSIIYGFDGEYWNDELKDYHLFLTSRCLETEAAQ
jgi:hypothetical protein